MLTTKEIAIRLGVTQETVRCWIRKGKLKATRSADRHTRGGSINHIKEEDFKSFIKLYQYTDTYSIQADKDLLVELSQLENDTEKLLTRIRQLKTRFYPSEEL